MNLNQSFKYNSTISCPSKFYKKNDVINSGDMQFAEETLENGTKKKYCYFDLTWSNKSSTDELGRMAYYSIDIGAENADLKISVSFNLTYKLNVNYGLEIFISSEDTRWFFYENDRGRKTKRAKT